MTFLTAADPNLGKKHSPMFGELVNLRSAGRTSRDVDRMDLVAKVRTERPHLRVIDTPQKRAELELWVMAEYCTPLSGWLKAMTYNNPKFFSDYPFESPDTTLRDSRELELLGFFEKPAKEPVEARMADIEQIL